MNSTARWASRIGLLMAATLAGVLNGSPLAAPVLLLMVYLLAVLVRQGRILVEAAHHTNYVRATTAHKMVQAYAAKYPQVINRGGVR